MNTDVAAEALGVSSRSVRNYILNGDLVARKEKEGVSERYVVSVDSLYALRDQRKQEGKLQGSRRRPSRQLESSGQGAAEMVRETAVDIVRETLMSLEMYIAQNAELRERLEAQRRAGSLEQERSEAQQRVERLAQEHTQLEEEHSRLEGEAERLREELESERSKGFWRRLFGG